MSARINLPTAEQSDAQLVAGHKGGDEAALDELYRRYHGRLVAALTGYSGGKEIAEDLAHDAILRAVERINTFDVQQPFWPWLRQIGMNLARDRFRRERRMTLLAEPEPEPFADQSQRVAERRVLAAALLDLPPRQRTALVLTYVKGWSPVAAAQSLGVTRNAFDQLLFRARANLRKAYLELEPDATTRTWGLIGLVLGALRRGKDSARSVMRLITSSVQPLAAAVALPLFIAGTVALAPAPERLQEPEGNGAAVVAHSGRADTPTPSSEAVRASGGPRKEGDAIGNNAMAQSRRERSRPPATDSRLTDKSATDALTISTRSERSRGRMETREEVQAFVAGDRRRVGHESDAACGTEFQRATCEAKDSAHSTVDTARRSAEGLELPAEPDAPKSLRSEEP